MILVEIIISKGGIGNGEGKEQTGEIGPGKLTHHLNNDDRAGNGTRWNPMRGSSQSLVLTS